MTDATPSADGNRPVDPIALSVTWNGLLSIAEEIGSTLRRTAFSEAVREAQDFSTGIFDRQARLIAQGNFSPGHLGSMPYVVKSVLEYFPPETLKPGDSVLVNDSLLGSGHFPDCFLISPVFLDGAIIGYVVNIAHHIDVGGAAPGSQKVHGVTESFQEGLRILPVRLVREGEFDQDLLRLILGNLRVPDKVLGDLRAQQNANITGAERLAAMFRDYGVEPLERVFDAILDRSEAHMRQILRDIPDGTYSFEDQMDDYGEGTPPIRIAVDVTIEGDEITVDYSRSSDQVPAAINSYINYTRAYTLFAVKVFCDALLPQNDGGIRPINVVAREGSFFNPAFPAPSGGRAALQIRMFETINGAFAQVLPERAMGAFSHWCNPNLGGLDDATSKPFVIYDLIFGGYGGRADKDGAEALAPVMNCANIPVEVQETQNPIRIHRFEMIQDSAGAGKYRGGCGVRKDVELLNSSATLSLLTDRHRFQPYGVFGGQPGQLAETILNPDGNAEQLGSKEVRAIKQGDVVSHRLAGAGGYGDPRERDPAAVRSDVADGYISKTAAAEIYGVDIDGSD
jgi:N-methylhydantoinase B